MKNVLAAIIAILYISTSTGAAIHMHYCMGKLADWSLAKNTSKTCGGCGMDKSSKKVNGCCTDETKFFKNNTDQKTGEATLLVQREVVSIIPVSFFELPAINVSLVSLEFPVSHAPPNCTIPLFILNRTFLI
jgi:hypothetical protein